ncbi:polysaccharide deacetylase-like protein [Lacihabitans sp. LS3-19]|uniref:polysaccharide deacetylase family protein n=1 Tax=Lacihabitans sp. LS3-19 TaxID=2487335 RepID=UPI0020CE0845|nr:polysaccharide deacetylase family protein [Lacihabitans sp. LS3-19]MCP9766356.1 polysaccharide deacetylase-like protein [Lacihabitans sp. LS3-19]
MKIIKVLILLFISNYAFSQTKKVCFTIDDLPVVNYGNNGQDFHLKLTEKLLTGLNQKGIKAIGFVNEGKMYDKDGEIIPFQKECLEMWLKVGMDLGNHTLRHHDFNNTDFNLYTSQIISGEKQTKMLLNKYRKDLKFFRHPFLHVGATKERADSLAIFLENNKYTVAPVTIDNEDYIFASAYAKTLNKGDLDLAKKIGEEYIKYMEAKVLFYEKQSDAMFGRQIAQTLLIHASQLNADYIIKLAEMFEKNGYEFVGLETALSDKAYETPITKFGRYGISWIDRWALSQGKKGDFFKGDPETPNFVVDLSK